MSRAEPAAAITLLRSDYTSRNNIRDFGQIEVVGDDADLGLVGDCLVESLEDRRARLEAHPGKRGRAVGMGRATAMEICGRDGRMLAARVEQKNGMTTTKMA
jgi:hypothetical protein